MKHIYPLLMILSVGLLSCKKEHCVNCYKGCFTKSYFQNHLNGPMWDLEYSDTTEYEPFKFCGTEKEIADKEKEHTQTEKETVVVPNGQGTDLLTAEATCICDCK